MKKKSDQLILFCSNSWRGTIYTSKELKVKPTVNFIYHNYRLNETLTFGTVRCCFETMKFLNATAPCVSIKALSY